MTINNLPYSQSLTDWFYKHCSDTLHPMDFDTRDEILEQVESSYNHNRNQPLRKIKLCKEGFELVFANGICGHHPTDSVIAFLGAWYALAFSDSQKSAEEKRELQQMIASVIISYDLSGAEALMSLAEVLKKVDEKPKEQHKWPWIAEPKVEVNNKIEIPLGVFFFVCDPRFPQFSIDVIKHQKELELMIWEYMTGLMPECKALGGVRIYIIETDHQWHNLKVMHQQIARFMEYQAFNAPPTPEFVFRLPSIKNVLVSHPELADVVSCSDGIDNDAVGFTFTTKGWMEEKFDVRRTAVMIANDFKEQMHEYNDKVLQNQIIKVASHYKLQTRQCKDMLVRAMWESEVDLMAIQEDRGLSYYEDDVLRFGIHEELPLGFASLLVNEWDMEESDLDIEYDHKHFYSADHKLFLDKSNKVREEYAKSISKIKAFELRHNDGCPEFYKISFDRTENKSTENSMYLADFYIDEYNSSPVRDFVNEWTDKHSDKHELELAEKNGKGKWNSCHEYYLEEAACFIVQSASSTPKDVKFGKNGIDFIKNGRPATYAYHPLKALPFLCMVHTLYTFSDKYMYDFEKREKLFAYLQCYYNKEFHGFIGQFYTIKQSGRTMKIPQPKSIAAKRPSAGNQKHAVEKCIKLEDKQRVIEEMKKELDKLPDGPSKALYIDSLVQNGTLSKFPSHQAFVDAGLITLTKTPWDNATRPFREALRNRRK